MELTQEEFKNTYQIHHQTPRLGHGSSACVKIATKKSNDSEEYAVKLMDLESSGLVGKHYEREVKSVLMLKHKNIVQFFGFCKSFWCNELSSCEY